MYTWKYRVFYLYITEFHINNFFKAEVPTYKFRKINSLELFGFPENVRKIITRCRVQKIRSFKYVRKYCPNHVVDITAVQNIKFQIQWRLSISWLGSVVYRHLSILWHLSISWLGSVVYRHLSISWFLSIYQLIYLSINHVTCFPGGMFNDSMIWQKTSF